MRKIEKIIVHCSAGSQKNTAADIVSYHTRPVRLGGRGWSVPGYHYIIETDGTVVNSLDEQLVSNGCYGHNRTAINVCYVGGVDITKKNLPPVDNRTPEQKISLERLLRELKRRYPEAKIHGHRDFAPKACPSFDATKEYATLCLLLVLLLFGSCRSHKTISEIPVPVSHISVSRDSLRDHMVACDTVIMRDSVVTVIRGDTLMRESWIYRERRSIAHDTVWRLRRDTIYKEKPVALAVRKDNGEKKNEPSWSAVAVMALLCAGIGFLLPKALRK